ncbi:MAG: S26 family signal peptidase [Candidatus Fusobacterium pullicola]|uniref:S26 family signal peptidase n=1 Tax=Candidatus Fusobacterium pullicola TaxID=2838601 RepID=A0A9E2L0U1_9FUSO|nr:S26 family signal peptidase [Candidatus Fusobacterium pullicola]
MKSIRILIKIIIVITIGILYFRENYTINVSPSIPMGIYKKIKIEEDLKIGDTVLIDIPKDIREYMTKRGYINDDIHYLIKKIGATSKDKVEVIDNKLYINNRIVREIPLKDSIGRQLIPARRVQPKENEFFLLGDTNNSFDGRYYGTINKKFIKYKAKEVYLFENTRKIVRELKKELKENEENTTIGSNYNINANSTSKY